jgi:hypothetical protein
MRVVMPLLQFQYLDSDEFPFSDGQLSLRRFTNAENASQREIFSKRDRNDIGQARYALVAESSVLMEEKYQQDVNLLLMAFRILGDGVTPMIQYRLSDNDALCARLDGTESHIQLRGYLFEVYSLTDFPRIDKAYVMLRDAECISPRLKNALFFLYKAFYSAHWIDAFLFCMNSLEALFSLDKEGPATKTICRRTSALLDDPANWSEATIKDLYRTRSHIAHGRIVASSDSNDNLLLLEKMERVTKLCFRKLIERCAFHHFETPASRDCFFASL